MSEAQEKIHKMLRAADRPDSWLAKKIGVSRSTMSYKLNIATDILTDEYNEMVAILNKEGVMLNSEREASAIKDSALEFSALIGHGVSSFVHLVKKYLDNDGIIDEDEREKLIANAKIMKKDFNKELTDVIDLLERGRM